MLSGVLLVDPQVDAVVTVEQIFDALVFCNDYRALLSRRITALVAAREVSKLGGRSGLAPRRYLVRRNIHMVTVIPTRRTNRFRQKSIERVKVLPIAPSWNEVALKPGQSLVENFVASRDYRVFNHSRRTAASLWGSMLGL